MTAGAFAPEVREAIYEVASGRCIGCGRVDVTAQHRRARGMGGTRDPLAATPANGLPLCGSGTTGCHGWTERHPTEGALLGWRLTSGQDQLVEPFYTRHGWHRWTVVERADRIGPVRIYLVAWVDEPELDRRDERKTAMRSFLNRSPGWR